MAPATVCAARDAYHPVAAPCSRPAQQPATQRAQRTQAHAHAVLWCHPRHSNLPRAGWPRVMQSPARLLVTSHDRCSRAAVLRPAGLTAPRPRTADVGRR